MRSQISALNADELMVDELDKAQPKSMCPLRSTPSTPPNGIIRSGYPNIHVAN